MKQKIIVSADHPSPAYRLDKQVVEVEQSRHDGYWSAHRARFGYVCGFNSKRDAIFDLLKANGCTNIQIEGVPA
jgi:hypothetical protein